jgi:hypothetical protein
MENSNRLHLSQLVRDPDEAVLIGTNQARNTHFIAGRCRQAAPLSVVNPPGVETSLASTALVLAKQTEAANPFTPTPPPTTTETRTPTSRISVNGTMLVVNEDRYLIHNRIHQTIRTVT